MIIYWQLRSFIQWCLWLFPINTDSFIVGIVFQSPSIPKRRKREISAWHRSRWNTRHEEVFYLQTDKRCLEQIFSLEGVHGRVERLQWERGASRDKPTSCDLHSSARCHSSESDELREDLLYQIILPGLARGDTLRRTQQCDSFDRIFTRYRSV